jgi:uncharacterized protein (DUF2141 family)
MFDLRPEPTMRSVTKSKEEFLMKRVLAAGVFLIAMAARGEQTAIEVKVKGFENGRGHALVSLVNSAKQFEGKAKPIASQKVTIENDSVAVEFTSVPPGEYAVIVTHDENDNGELDMNSIGIPEEAFGFSNNPVIRRGPPKFEEAKFVVARADVSLDIKVAMLKLF